MARGAPAHEVLVRRSPWAVAHWDDDGSRLVNAVRAISVPADPADLALVAAAGTWVDAADLSAILPGVSPSKVRARVRRLVRAGILERADSAPDALADSARTWRHWGVPALWFHATARDVRWATADEVPAIVGARAADAAEPALPTFPRRGGVALALPAGPGADAVADTLRSRRTWRRFARRPVPFDAFSTLVHLSFGVQAWMHGRLGGPYALKTSPSGGACHPLDAFVVVQRVEGILPGVYAYDPDGHRLHRVGTRRVPDLRAWFPGQAAYPRAGAVCVLAARFARLQWKYRSARAYRVVMLDAGHVGQTFCLVATRLGLAPCGTGAFDDRAVEAALGLDGVSRAAVYAMGVGVRPAGTDWAPFPDPADVPRLGPPASAGRR